MNSTLKFFLPLVIFLALAALLAIGLTRDPRAIPSTFIDKPIPEFTRPDLLDPSKLVTHEDLKGGISLVNVWGTWCGSCRLEHPELVRIASKERIKIVGFNWRDDRQTALGYLRGFGNPYAANAMIGDTDPLIVNWGVVGAPETFIVDQGGTIRYKHIGPITRDIWDKTLQPIVQQLEEDS